LAGEATCARIGRTGNVTGIFVSIRVHANVQNQDLCVMGWTKK